MTGNLKTVSDIIGASYDTLTRAERQLAETLLDNYPVSGLVSITALAENARVSTPTVVRMVQKLGFSGFPDFQSRLHQELEETISNPISKHDRWAADAPGTHILNRFADAVVANMRDSLSHISIPDFDRAAAELSNRKKPVYLAGGRITHALADYFFTHLQVIRSGVTLISTNRSTWPQYVLNMRPGNILVLFDIRRYEQEMETMAKIAAERGIFIILFTDTWGSPVAKHSKVVFRLNIEVPSAWDSSVMTLVLVEALIEAVQSANWDSTRERISDLEELFDTTSLFRRPIRREKRGKQQI